MSKIAACMILGDQYDKQELEDCINSIVEANIDTLYIAFNGKNYSETEKFLKRFKLDAFSSFRIVIKQFDWEDDFSVARNQSFQMVNKYEHDWEIWIDSDDIIIGDIKEIADSVSDDYDGAFLRYDYAVEPDTGQVVVQQWRERLFRTSIDWTWRHPIHEICTSVGVTFIRKEGAYLSHLRKNGEDRGARVRNRRIIAKAVREHPDEPRFVFYLGGETMAEADVCEDKEQRKQLCYTAIHAYEKFKDMVREANDDYFIATIRIAECFRMCGQFEDSYTADLDAIGIYPSWADGYIGAAKSTMELGDFSRMLSFANIAASLPLPTTSASIESMNYTFTPLFLQAIANEGLGNYETAIRQYKEADAAWPGAHKQIKEKIDYLKNAPKSQASKADTDRKRLKGTHPEKSIAFLTTPIPESWHPELMKENGSGGAELCIMKLAPYFAADGYRTVVFGTPGEHRGYYEQDGVEYWDAEEYVPSERFKYLVSSRTTIPFTMKRNADKSVLWLHDVNAGEPLLEVKNVPDKIICLTPWHRQHVSKLYGIDLKDIAIVPNGIDIDRFPADLSRPLGTNFIWSSSYDRGLETVLGLWPVIKSKLPGATLDIFYGWNMFDKTIEQWLVHDRRQADYLLQFKLKIESMMKMMGNDADTGITHHGRVSQEELAATQLKADIWPYPTQFMETSCITALEMQAAGVIPITSSLAALNDNVAAKQLLINGWPQNVAYQNQFLDRIEQVYSLSPGDILQLRQEGRQLAESFTWEFAYQTWLELLSTL